MWMTSNCHMLKRPWCEKWCNNWSMELRSEGVLDYCGLTLDYTEKGIVKIGVEHHISETLNDFPEEIGPTRKTPAAEHPFKVDETCTPLNETRRKLFHSIFAKLLWIGKKARPDILVVLSFLGKRIEKAHKDDWKKLVRVLAYLKGTLDLRLCLGAADTTVVEWWADSSFAVHHDLRSHTGTLGSLGQRAFYSSSKAQKLNTTSSTVAEVVAAAEVVPQMLWTTSYLKHQGCEIDKAVLHQDNKASILLQKNGVLSRGKATRHMDVRFFFIKDRIDSGDIDICFCGTENMTADFLTKPLQGNDFNRLRNLLLGTT